MEAPSLPARPRLLVFGAGVLGSVYATRLSLAGNDVTVLDRGERVVELRERGLVVEDVLRGTRQRAHPTVIEVLRDDDRYDLALVIVQKTQLDPVLAAVSSNSTPSLLFMVSNALGPGQLTAALAAERVVLGFAGAGGLQADGVVHYTLAPRLLQPTTIGELDGRRTPRLEAIARMLRAAGFPTAISPNMDAWLKTHEAWISPLANAIYAAGGNAHALAHDRQLIHLYLRALREGFAVLAALGVPLTPPKFRLLQMVPEALLARACARLLDTRLVEILATGHANAAREEMTLLTKEFAQLAEAAAVATPAMNALSQLANSDLDGVLVSEVELDLRPVGGAR
jgi:2-dehydropantoate 2-reductase